MILRALQSFTLLFCLLTFSNAVWAQGTIQFIGFEEYSLGATPPFVRKGYAAEPDPKVADGSNYPLFEGQKLLQASGVTVIESPNHELIQSR